MPITLRASTTEGWKLETERFRQVCHVCLGGNTKTVDTAQEIASIPPIKLHSSYIRSLLPVEDIKIVIKTLDRRDYTLKVEPTISVRALKQRIEEVEGTPTHGQRLIYAGKELDDAEQLHILNIQNDATIHLVAGVKRKKITPCPKSDPEDKEVKILMCCACKFALRERELEILHSSLESFVITKGELMELDLCSFARCQKLKKFVLPLGSNSMSKTKVRFTKGLPRFPESLENLQLNKVEDTERNYCDFSLSLAEVRRLKTFVLHNMKLRKALPAINAFATLKTLELNGVLAPAVNPKLW